MKTDNLRQYVSARKALLHEKAQLEARLQQIDRALGHIPSAATVPAQPPTQVVRRVRNPISMRAAVLKVTTGHPLAKPEILAAIQKLGFRSASKNPMNVLGTLLYGRNPRFKNEKGRFSPLSTAMSAAGVRQGTHTVKPAGKRKISKAGPHWGPRRQTRSPDRYGSSAPFASNRP